MVERDRGVGRGHERDKKEPPFREWNVQELIVEDMQR